MPTAPLFSVLACKALAADRTRTRGGLPHHQLIHFLFNLDALGFLLRARC